MTVEEYRRRLMDVFHNVDLDYLIALVALPEEKEFKNLESLLKREWPRPNTEPCEDCIKRKYIRKMLIDIDEAICVGDGFSYEYWKEKLAELPSVQPTVTPQEPKTGHWIIDTHKVRASVKKNETHDYSVHCDKCNYAWDYTTDKEGSLVSNFCPNCGAKMESEE